MIEFRDFTDSGRLVLLAGPCVIESEEHAGKIADSIVPIAKAAGFSYVFKASFDKANRTSPKSYRGPGVKEGLRILTALRARGLSVVTDIHEPAQAAAAAEAVDILQIPAFLCRQTDLLLEAGKTGRIVNIKKGQFVAPHDIHHAADKVASTGNTKIVLTERGSSFGYNNLVVDMRGLKVLADSGWPVVFDATHSVQLPSGAGGVSGGQPQFIEPLASAAVAVGVSGIFVEVHDQPEKALSDGANALRLSLLADFLEKLRRIDEAHRTLVERRGAGGQAAPGIPRQPGLLATIRLAGVHRPSETGRELHAAIATRRTNRRPYSNLPVPPGVLGELTAAARLEGAVLHLPGEEETHRLLGLVADAERDLLADPGYRAELAR